MFWHCIFIYRPVTYASKGVACDMSNNEIEHGKLVEEFAKAGRTGRRNALPDVFSISQGAACGTTDLTAALQQLQTSASASAGLYIILLVVILWLSIS